MNTDKIELNELWLTGSTGSKRQDFETKFDALLGRTTFTGSTSKPEYWMGFFLGGLASVGASGAQPSPAAGSRLSTKFLI